MSLPERCHAAQDHRCGLEQAAPVRRTQGFFVCLKGVGTQGRHPSWTSAKQTVFGAALTKPQPDSFTTDVHRLAGNGLPDDPASTMQKVPMFAQNAVNAHVG